MITFADFLNVEMHVGTILQAEVFAKARKPAYILTVDFGETIGVKKTSAQITDLYQPENLIDQQVIAVTNFPPKQIANIMSEVLVLGAVQENGDVILMQPERATPNGTRIA